MSLWLVSICTRYLGHGTEYVRLITHPSWVILDSIPTLSTRCIDAFTRSHWSRCPCAFRVPFTNLYPACGILSFISETRSSTSASVMALYIPLTERLLSAILLYSVAREIPTKLAIVTTGSPSSSRCLRYSTHIVIFGRPHPLCMSSWTGVGGRCWCSLWFWSALHNSINFSVTSWDTGIWCDITLRKTISCLHTNSR